MGKRNRIQLDLEEFNTLADKLRDVGGDVEEAAKMTLIGARDIITPQARTAIQRHHRTGRTESSLRNNQVQSKGDGWFYVDVGFDIKNGGLPSVFLMYGTPRQKKDTKFYNALKGKRTRKLVQESQRKTMQQWIRGALIDKG